MKRPQTPNRKSSLSVGKLRLVNLCSSIRYGTISRLHIKGGEPLFDPPPRIVHEYKFASADEPIDFPLDCALKREVLDLIELLDQLSDGVIETLIVRRGLPYHATFEGAIS